MGFAAAIAAVSTGFQIAGSIAGAMGQKEGADAAAYAAQRRVEAGKLKALQTDTAMREELFRTMGNIDAVRAAANADPNSPTIFAIKQNTRGNMDTDRRRAVGNIESQVAEDQAAVKFYRSYGRRAMLGGLLSAGGQLASGLSGAMKGSSVGAPMNLAGVKL